jgi:Cof subfamily protein (haloacid dehalogenase superfamily)
MSRGIRLVAVDLDGTLLDDQKEMDRATVRLLRKLPELGIRVVIASARPPRSVREIYHRIGLNTLQINYNGALVWDELQRQALHHLPLPGRTVLQIARESRQAYPRVVVSCEILDRWLTDRDDPRYGTATGQLFAPDHVGPLADFLPQPVTKLMLAGSPRRITGLREWLRRRYIGRVGVLQTDPHLLQVVDSRVGKASALRRVARAYGVPMAQVLAIGDAPNDLEMIRAAGIGVAMGNAHRSVKSAADWVAPSNNDGGVLAALRRFLPC